MITLLENSQTRDKHTYNFVDDRGKVIGFNPYPDGRPIKYSIRDRNGHQFFSELDGTIDLLLVGMPSRFEYVTLAASNDDDTINAIDFTLVKDSDPECIYSVHVEGRGGEYYYEDLGLSKDELQELFSTFKIKEAEAAVAHLAETFKSDPSKKKFESARVIDNAIFGDSRGWFSPTEPFFPVAQINISHSRKGVIRGMHWQKGDFSQKKVVRVLSGTIMDVVMDLRKGSPTYQQIFKFKLNEEGDNPLLSSSLYVPAGFAHGFQALEDNTTVMYFVDKYYSEENEMTMNPTSSVFGEDCFDYSIATYSKRDRNSPVFFEISPDDYPNG